MLTVIEPNGKCPGENMSVSKEVWKTNLGRAPDKIQCIRKFTLRSAVSTPEHLGGSLSHSAPISRVTMHPRSGSEPWPHVINTWRAF